MNIDLRFLILITLMFPSVFGNAQSFNCGTDELMRDIQKHHSLYSSYLQKEFLSAPHSQQLRMSSTIHPDTIPVVVHVVDNTGTINSSVSDADIVQMIDNLNRDFAKLNPDTTQIPAAFQAFASSLPYRFCLAKRAPDGSAHSGIIRVNSTHAPWTSTFQSVFELQDGSMGGSNSWSSIVCMNIYISDLVSGIAGFASLGSAPIVVDFLSISGRTITHEAGHCFGLNHIWGPNSGMCSDDDAISDTPLQWGPSSGFPSFPSYDSCTTTGNGLMFMNYMDYSFSRMMFSQGQVHVMDSVYDLRFDTLQYSNACEAVPANDAGLNMLTQVQSICNPVSIAVIVKNFGAQDLSSVDINYNFDGTSGQIYNWTGLLHPLETDTVYLPSVSLNQGVHDFSSFTSNPNLVNDIYNSNDSANLSFSVNAGSTIPIFESFEDSMFMQTHGWQIYNPDNDLTWAQVTNAGYTGTSSIMINNHPNFPYGKNDDLIIPLDLSNYHTLSLTFYNAYTYPSNVPTFTDTLIIFISTDGGTNFTEVTRYNVDSLQTAPPVGSTTVFVPTSSQWRFHAVDLTAYLQSGSCYSLKFRNRSAAGLQLYLDDINITGILTSVTDIDRNMKMVVYPNPASSEINVSNVDCSKLEDAYLMSSLGQKLKIEFNKDATTNSLKISTKNIASGMYFLFLESSDSYLLRKPVEVIQE